eukprot:657307-Hanusia_phi.AAC.1
MGIESIFYLECAEPCVLLLGVIQRKFQQGQVRSPGVQPGECGAGPEWLSTRALPSGWNLDGWRTWTPKVTKSCSQNAEPRRPGWCRCR